jgi:hypothetical protein
MLPEFVDAKVTGDSKEPGSEGAICAQIPRSSNNPQKRLCRGVFGVGAIVEHPIGVAENPLTVQFVYGPNRGRVTVRQSVE